MKKIFYKIILNTLIKRVSNLKQKSMKNWKTTLFGAILGGLIAIQPVITTGEINWYQAGIGFLVGAMGYLAKDAGVTGTEK
jgi:hypothetical protein